MNALSLSSVADLFQIQHAKAASRRRSFGRAERLAALDSLRRAILAHEREIITALAADFAKPEVEVRLTEIMPVLQDIREARRHLRAWMRPRRVWPGLMMLGTSAWVEAQPKGVALIIAPWNFPVNLALGPLVSALAAGCSVILKPSEMTPTTSALLARIVATAFPPDLVAVIEGGPEISTAALALPFDHIFFTGSPAIGKVVMAAAAKTLASVTLELGGKSPVVILPGADLGQAAKWVAWGKFVNAGQTCIAPDHVFVHASLIAGFTATLRAEITAMYGTTPLTSVDLANVVNARHFDRLRGLLDEALAAGAKLVTGGQTDAGASRIAPTVLAEVGTEMRILQEEIFGPILPLIGFSAPDEVVDRINAGPKPLTLYLFGPAADCAGLRAATSSGSVAENLTLLQFSHPNLPFGGIGNSGQGAAHGKIGFDAFSHQRAVIRNRFTVMPMLFPPYGQKVKKLVSMVLRLVR